MASLIAKLPNILSFFGNLNNLNLPFLCAFKFFIFHNSKATQEI